MIDKNGKIFGIVNVIDLLVVLLVVGAAVFILSRRGAGEAATGPEGMFTMSFTNFVVDDFVVDHMNIGDSVLNEGRTVDFGTVIDLDRGPSVEFHANSNGILVETSRDGFSSITVTTELPAQAFDNGIIIGGNRFAVGQSVTLRVGNTIFFPRISNIEAM